MHTQHSHQELPVSRSRRALLAAAALAALPAVRVRAAAATDRLVLAGPPITVSFPLIHMVESGALAEEGVTPKFALWTNPDQMRAWAVEGGADFIASPTNVAANLYNRGVPLRLLNVSVWGILWLVTRNGEAGSLADFRGQEIAVPFRGDMPDILFGVLARAQGLDPQKDFSLRYVTTPFDAVQLLVLRRVSHAVLPEPAMSMALRKTQSLPVSAVAPKLHRGLDLSAEWGRVLKREPRIPQAGLAALGKALGNAALCERVRRQYAASQAWCLENPEACGELVAKHIRMLTPQAVADALKASRDKPMAAASVRAELEYFFQRVHEVQPGLIGGKLPAADFYG